MAEHASRFARDGFRRGEFVSRISARDPRGDGVGNDDPRPCREDKALNRALGAWEKIDPAKAESWKQANNLGN